MTNAFDELGRAEMPAAPCLAVADLMGVWRRDLLVTPDGRRDDTSDVYWLQSQTICGDMRRETDPASAKSRLKGFAGRLTERDGVFRWERTLASFPLDGPPDDGRLSWQGEILREDGVHEPYWEIWVRVARASPGDYAAELCDPRNGRLGYALSIGDFGFFAHRPALAGTDAAFALNGLAPASNPLTLAIGHHPIDWRETGFPKMPGDAMRLPERDAEGNVILTDWSVAVLERPYLPPAGATPQSGGKGR